MTSYFSTTIGQREQLDRLLDQAGFSLEDVKKILVFPYLAGTMVNALHAITHGSTRERVEQQLNTWKSLGVAISDERWEQILQQADVFDPYTDTDEPLVTGGFGYNNPRVVVDKLINAFTPAQGYTKVNYLEGHELRYAPGFRPKGELRLVHYDANAYAKLSPLDARKAAKKDGLQLAGIEVFEHLMLKPKTGFTWDGKLYYYPNASGLDRKVDGTWSGVPYVDRWDVSGRLFVFDSNWVDGAGGEWSSPVVREC